MNRPTLRSRWTAALGAVALVAAGVAVGAPTAAATSGFSVNVAPTTGLNPTGDTVSVTLSGLPDGQGVFVRLCVQPQPGTRPAAGTCDGQGIWAVENFPFGPAPTDGSVVKPSAGPVVLPVRAAFSTLDCTTSTCGVHTRRDSVGGATDFALDTFTPLTFGTGPTPPPTSAPPTSAPPTTAPPTSAPPTSAPPTSAPPTTAPPSPSAFAISVTPTTDVTPGDSVAVSVTGVPSDQGIYVRWCAAPAQGQTRPTADQCDGQGIWALENYPFGPRPTDGTVVDPTEGPIALTTTATIGTIDCITATCGVSTRRDHRGGADTSMDTFTPVTLGGSGEGDGGSDGGAETTGTADLSTTQAAPGDEVTVSGDGFQGGETIDGTLFSDPVDLGSTTSDDDGSGSLTFTVPDVEAGTHTVQLEGAESGRIVTATLTVTEAEPSTTGDAAAGALPATGGTAGGILPWALTALALGAALTLGSRWLRRDHVVNQ